MADVTSTPYGKRLIPVTVDQIAHLTPNKTLACIPFTYDLKDGFRDVSFGDFARAVDRTAWWLESSLGKSTTFTTLAYIGPSDLRYFILIIAACKVGYTMFLPSPRNSLEGQVNLFKKTSCNVLITTPINKVQVYIDQYLMRLIYVPDLEDLLAPGEIPRYKYLKSFDEAKDDPLVVLHTSGSTGLPKPVLLTQSWVCGLDRLQNLGKHDGCGVLLLNFVGKRIFSCLPAFHAASIMGCLVPSVFYNAVAIWHPVNRPLSAFLVEEILDALLIDIVFAAPSILEDLSQLPEAVEKLSMLKAVHFGGGPLSRQAGEIISKKAPICNTIGTTESSCIPFYQVTAEDWEYFHTNPNLKGLEFRHQNEQLYELVIVRHPSTDPYHATWATFPDLIEHPTNDLYVKHPTKPNHWLSVGRSDDIIVLSNGEKLSPVGMEAALRDHPDVDGALVVGQGKFSIAAIVELRHEIMDSAIDRARFVDKLWPYVVAANEKAPAHAQLAKDKIMIAPPEKPFPRAGKGTVQRGATVKLFEGEIKALFLLSEDMAMQHLPKIDPNQDNVSLQKELVGFINLVASIESLAPDQDFFSSGMDSLNIWKLVKHLKSALTETQIPQGLISTRIIYTNPTIATLAAALKALSNGRVVEANEPASADTRDARMLDILQKYLDNLPVSSCKNARTPQEDLTVILTGSTGSLGSYLLNALAVCPQVTKIYCLNRKADASNSQAKINAARGLVSNWGTKVDFLQADLSKPDLGLTQDNYANLLQNSSVIIHNQWQVDFNLSLPSFQPHIAGVSNLIKLSAASAQSPQILFTSSIGTVGRWNEKHRSELVPEISIDDPGVVECQGYSESKWIAERLLDAASKRGVSSAIFRVGQIAGPVERREWGMWNIQEWLPSIIASSKYLGTIPISLGPLDEVTLIPVDILSKIIVDLMLKGRHIEGTWTKYYHLENPRSCPWPSLVPVIQEHFSCVERASQNPNGRVEEKGLKAVSIDEWVNRLKESGRRRDLDMTKNPALKLLEFYQSLNVGSGPRAKLDVAEACQGSPTLRNLKAVDGEWMRLWLRQWNS